MEIAKKDFLDNSTTLVSFLMNIMMLNLSVLIFICIQKKDLGLKTQFALKML